MSQQEMNTEILLEAGTNEFEVLTFELRGGWYGVNVAKVREVIRWVRPHECPNMHESVLGMFNLRGQVLSIIDLGKHLGLGDTNPEDPSTRIIVTEFNGVRCGFAVNEVERIHRISWQQVRAAPELDGLDATGITHPSSCTGIVELDGHLVLMLDFESVADAIMHEERLHAGEVANPLGVDRAAKRVIVAEDSPFMRDLIRNVFRKSGYARAEVFQNGQEAWERIEELYAEDGGPEDIEAVISDIEMPLVDGLNLCRRIKSAKGPLSKVPVVLFSSLISEDNLKKGRQVGADAQVAKPHMSGMVELVDRVVSGESLAAAAA